MQGSEGHIWERDWRGGQHKRPLGSFSLSSWGWTYVCYVFLSILALVLSWGPHRAWLFLVYNSVSQSVGHDPLVLK